MLRDDRPELCVIGLGYIGLPTAGMFAAHGYGVRGVDVNPSVVRAVSCGEIHLNEPGLGPLIRHVVQAGTLTAAGTPAEADVFIVAVPTPIHVTAGGTPDPDLTHVAAAAGAIVPYLRPGNLVILESTSPPGTTEGVVRPILEQSGLSAGRDFMLAYCAERVIPGRILVELAANDRVVGGIDRASAERAAQLYRSFVTGEIFVTDATTAEMVKLMENTARDVNIALANEFGRICQALGVSVHEAISLANRHPRVNILQPGPGVGGHCIAVDPWFIAGAYLEDPSLIRTARAINDGQPRHVAELIMAAVHDIPDPVVAVLGLAYKADVEDVRESPSLEVVRLLRQAGIEVRPHDALVSRLPDGSALEPDLARVLDGADVMALLTDHTVYRALTPSAAVLAGLSHQRLVDTRSCFDHETWRAAGFTVHSLGDGQQTAILSPVG